MSAYTHQLIDLKRSPVKNVAGSCVDSEDFLDTVNAAQQRLFRRGNWWDTEWLVELCLTDGCVTWPRYVSTVLGIRSCNGGTELRNNWYSIIGQYQNYSGGIGGIGDNSTFGYMNRVGSTPVITDADSAPCYNEISGNAGKLIRYNVVKRSDIGKKLTIYGTQYGGQPLREQDANGDWIDGLTITAAAPFASTSVLVTKITSVTREATAGMAYLYEYDADTNLLRDLACYEPNETNPRYRRSRIESFCNLGVCKDANGVNKTKIQALVKLQFIPLKDDRDFLLIDNFDAIKFMVQAIKLEEAGQDSEAEVKILKAVRELNLEQRDKQPDRQTTVSVNSIMGFGILSPI